MVQLNGISLKSLVQGMFCILILNSCARYQTYHNLKTEDYTPSREVSSDSLLKRIFLLGDIAAGKESEILKYAGTEARLLGEKSIVLFLGDQVDRNQFGKLNNKVENALRERLKPYKGLEEKSFFIPGDKDWGRIGPKAIDEQEAFLQDELSENFKFVPDDGCSGPKVIELADSLVLIAVNSAWLLSDWDEYRQVNESCDLRTREQFYYELHDEIKKYYRTHNVIVAMHHPVMSAGYRGGYFSFNNHIFPIKFKDQRVPLPLPGIGSVATFFRSKIGSRQDLIHPQYREFSNRMEDFKRDYPGLIFVSAHEQSLQYIKNKANHYIISGASTHATPVRDKENVAFGHGALGFAVLDVYKNGAVNLKFIGKGKRDKSEKILFDQQIKAPFPPLEKILPDSFPLYESGQKTITTSVLQPGEIKLYNPTWWGKLNSEYYFKKIEVPILDLETAHGGLTPIRRGGGKQTQSLHLIDEHDHLYKLRSLKKESNGLLPYPFNKTFLTDVMAYMLTAGHPYGALALDKMAETINIYYTTPKLYYLPKQPVLAEHISIPTGLYLLEERPDEDWRTLDHFGNSKDIISCSNMIENRLEDSKTVIDQEWTVRTRLFDMLIGDWDRHLDQWRWASKPVPGTDYVLYRPIPRDRDQAFSKFDGIIPGILRQTLPGFRSTQSFDYTIKKRNVKWLNRGARDFDRLFLNQVEWKDWEKEVKKVQVLLTDEAIEASVKLIPPEIYNSGIGREWIAKLKQRRDELMEYAKTYYNFLYKKVQIPATHKDNIFEINRLNDHQTEVSVFEIQEADSSKVRIYRHVFDHAITKELILYGLDGDDEFKVEGNVKEGLLLRLVGGNGNDKVVDRSHVNG